MLEYTSSVPSLQSSAVILLHKRVRKPRRLSTGCMALLFGSCWGENIGWVIPGKRGIYGPSDDFRHRQIILLASLCEWVFLSKRDVPIGSLFSHLLRLLLALIPYRGVYSRRERTKGQVC